MLIYLSAFCLTVTLLICVVNSLSSCLFDDVCENFYVKRWIISFIISLSVAVWGLKRKSLDWTGAVGGVIVGLILTFSSYCFLACLLTFFYTSSKATHFCSEKKRKLEANYKEGGQRNWVQVLCNGGAATEIALLYLLHGDIGEAVIDFDRYYVRSWLAASVLSALAGANGDTWASEIGTVVSKSQPRLITTLQKVPIGTNGGFTVAGVIYSAFGGAAVGIAYFVALLPLYESRKFLMNQVILLTLIGTFAGLFGSLLDSLMGATLQYSGIDRKTGKIVEHPGDGVKHISGRPVLNNHSVNMIMSIVNSIVVPTITARLYPFFK